MASPYGYRYQQNRAAVLAKHSRCRCGRKATETDHQPPIALHTVPHAEGTGCCVLVPSCGLCARRQGANIRNRFARTGRIADELVEADEPAGYPADDHIWDVHWLERLRDVPESGTWPRLMTAPHPDAVDSYGHAAIAWLRDEAGIDMRWWQQLALTRQLEHDDDGQLLWLAELLTTARQVGKSTLLRGAATWRIHQTDLLGEPQTVVHTGKDLPVCKEVQKLARAWAKQRGYPVREQNGNEEITEPATGSRWIVRGKGSVYGYSAGMVIADEAWGMNADVVDDGLESLMLERRHAQLIIASTAHPHATSLFPTRRNTALTTLGNPRSTLLIEWSAHRDADLDDEGAWRDASPYWHPGRAAQIADRIARVIAGEDDETDNTHHVDPVTSARAQILNIWSARIVRGGGAPLISHDDWTSRPTPTGTPVRMWIAVEDNYGAGAAVAAVAQHDNDQLEVDGWLCDTRDAAIDDATRLRDSVNIPATIILSAGIPQPRHVATERAGTRETRIGLPLWRAALPRLVHDATPDLDEQIRTVHVREVAGGLAAVTGTRSDIVRAASWALLATITGPADPAIH